MFSFPEVRYDPLPFPHCIVRGAWDAQLLRVCKHGLDRVQWSGEKRDAGKALNKQWCNDWDALPHGVPDFHGDGVRVAPRVAELIEFAHRPRFLRWLQFVTGEPCLLPDPYLHGGGIHRVSRGGFLKMHTDFNFHEQLHLYRRLNLLLYLNEGWQDEWGGHLTIGKKRIAPEMNTMVIFTTDDNSLHGHPEPLECPEGVHRDSIALYYYSAIEPKNFAGIRPNTNYDA